MCMHFVCYVHVRTYVHTCMYLHDCMYVCNYVRGVNGKIADVLQYSTCVH